MIDTMKKSALSVMLALFTLCVLGGGTAYSQAATQLAVTDVNGGVPPQAGVGFTLTVESRDASNAPSNVISGTTVTLTLNTGTGALGGTVVGSIGAGTNSIVISGITYTTAETNVSLTATATAGDALSPVDTTPFTVLAGPPNKLVFGVQPSTTSGGATISPAVTVRIADALGNTVTTDTRNVSLAIGTNPSGGVLTGGGAVAAVAGVATFSGLSIDKSGVGYTLTASSIAPLTGATSGSFNITVGTPTKVAFTTQPGNGTGGSAFSPQPIVALEDAGGNIVTGTAQNITLAIQNNAGPNAILSGTKTLAVNTGTGLATFSGLSIDSAGSGYTLTATGNLVSTTPGVVVSSPFNITAGPATKIAITRQPGNGTGGSPLSTQPVVTLQDAGGNTVTGFAQSITFAIQDNAGPGGVISGTNPVAVNTGTGQAVFTNLSIDKLGNPYTLTATGSTVSTTPGVVISSGFNITAGPAAKIAITTQPGNGTGGSPLTTQPVVTLEDAGGNTVTGTAQSITMAIQNNAGPAGVLSGTNPVAVNTGTGQATFTNLSIDKTGSGYTLTATGSTVSTTPGVVVSSGFNVTIGAPSKLAFGTQPSTTLAGGTITPAVTVRIEDAGGNTVTSDTRNVSLAIGTNPSGGVLTGGGPFAASAGVATFSGLSIDKSGVGYTLTASSIAPLAGATSNAFNIGVGTAAKIAFTTQPGNGTGGSAFSTQPVVALEDAAGNIVTGTAQNITLAIQNNAGPNAILSGTKTVAVNTGTGLATFSGLSIDSTGNGYTLTATGSTVSMTPGVVVSTAFNITTGLAAKIAITTQPGNGTGGSPLTPQPVVTLQDAGGNTVTGTPQSITFAIQNNAGPGGVISGTNPVAVNTGTGQAAFTNLSIDKPGNGYTLTATGSTVSTTPGVVVSSSFNVTVGPAAKLAFGVQPSGAAGGATITPPVTVLIQDAGGNTVTTDTRSVSLAIGTNPSGGVLTGGGAVAADAGVATFSGLSIDKNGAGYTLVASSAPVLTGATSNPFTIATGGVTHFTVEQTGGGIVGSQSAGTPFGLRITAKDAGGNTVTAFVGTVNLTSTGNISAGAGPTTAFVNGVLDPWAVTISNVGSFSITATRNGGSEAGTSNVFVVNPGAVNNFLVENAGGGAIPQQTAGAAFNIRLTARDANNNTATGFTGTASLTSNAALVGAPLTTGNFVAGVLASQSVTVTLAGSGNRTITATRTAGSETGTSAAFTVIAGSPALIVVSAGDNQTVAVGGAFPVALAALVSDGFANPVNGATVTFASPAAGASGTWTGGLHSTTAPTNASGIATVPLTFSANGTAGAYVDTARVAGAGIPALFHLANTAAAASKLVIVTPPSTPETAGSIFATQPVIWVEDASNNLVTSFSGTVTAARTVGTGALQGTVTVNVVNGVATFSNLSYNTAETITLTFSSIPALATAATGNIVVRPGAPSTVAFVVPPSTATAGVAIAPAVTAEVRDAFANVITTAGIPVTVAMNTGSGVLSGTLTQNTVASGLATFANLSIDLSGSKTLIASSSTYTAAISAPFTINPAAANRVAFVQEPTNANAGAAITPALTVQLKDPFGNNANTPVSSVTLALLTGTGALNGTVTQPTNGAGLATFAGLSINLSGTKTLRATSGAFTPDTSQTFSISALAASRLVFVQGPSNAIAGASIVPPVTVQLQDALGNNIAASGTTVTLTLNGTGSLDGTPPTQITDTFGVATFSNLTIDLLGSKTLTAQASGLASATSLPFTISAAAASRLAFTTQPGGGTAGQAFAQQPVVTLQDAFGNTVTGTAQNVTLALQANPGADVLGGTTTVAVNTGTGQAVFAGLLLTHVATGYTLTATGNSVNTGAGNVVSASFNVVHAGASEVRVETLADGSGVVLPAQNVSSGTSITVYSIARDSYHNFISDTVATWSLDSPVGVAPADLVAGGNGRSATFTGAKIGTATIRAATTGIATQVTSGLLTVVVAGVPSRISVETLANGAGVVLPDSTISSGRSIRVYAIARDNAGNFVRNVTANWSVQNASGGVVAGDLTPSAGRSTVFTGHVIGTGQIRADSAGLTAVTSGTVTVIHGTAASVTATAGSGQSALIGAPFATPMQATVRDSSNNLVGAGVSVTFSTPGLGAGGTFAGGATSVPVLTNASSVAIAPLFTANKTAGTYADSARIAGGFPPALFVLTNTPGGATLIFPVTGTTPQHVQIANPFPVALAVVATDSSGNRVPGVTVTFTPPTTASSGTFVGNSTVVSDVTGTATAPAYIANAVSGPDTVKATAVGVIAPARFILTNDPAGAQNIVVNRTQFDTTVINTAFKDSLQVAVRDQFNNPVSGVWITFTAPSAGASAIFARTGKTVDSALTTTAGLATSSALTANTVAGDYQIIARISGTSATATFFRTNKAGLVTRFAIESAPGGGLIGTQIATAPFDVLISSRDAYNNVASFPGTVNINVTSNGPLTAGGGIVAFNAGLIQSMVFQSSGTSDTIKVVRVGGAEKGASNGFAVVNPAPTVTSITPNNGRKGQVLDVVIGGTGFISGTTVPSLGGSIVPLSWTVNSSTQMTVTISISGNARDSAYSVSVINGAPGGGTGTLLGGFSVGLTPAPKVLSVLPASGARLQTLNVVVRGSNFYGGVTVLNLGVGIKINATTVDSVNQLTAGITILAAAATGPRDVVVVNSVQAGTGGGTDTLKGAFSVVNPLPTVYDVAPGGGARLTALTLGISGTNFIGGVSTVSLGDTGIVVNSVTVDSATHITAAIAIGAGAAAGLHAVAVTNTGLGGGTASLPNSFTVFNPVPALTSVQPNAANRSQTLNIVFRGSNFVRGASRVLFKPSSDITVNAVSVDSVTQITAGVTIGSGAVLGQRFVAIYNGVDTSGSLGFNVNLSAPPIPVLVAPGNGSTFQPTTVALRWSPSASATGYNVQFARVQTFLPPVVDTVVTDTFMVVGPLAISTTYYWHVAAVGLSSTSSFSAPWSFVPSYPARVAILDTVVFPTRSTPSDYLSTDFRLVGLPGSGPTPVQNYLPGTAGTDWSVVWDNGHSANYWVSYAPGSPFVFGAGRGFWLVNKGNWIVKDTVTAAVLDGNGRASVALHPGWNIITDPFPVAVNWSDIAAASPPTRSDHPVFTYNNGWPATSILQPYAGYYFENTDSLSFLQIPFRSAPGTAKATAAAGTWRIRLDLEAGGFVDQVTTLGVSPDARAGRNALDFHRPRLMKGIPALIFARPEWDAVNGEFATDIRPPVQNVETWKFEVRTSLRTPAKISFRDVAGVPENLQVYLFDEGRARSVDLRAAAEYPFIPATDVSAFRVVVGTPDALRRELDALLPGAFALGNNFPNPFNPETTIPVSVPLASEIRLVVYNILGSEVRTVYAGPVEAGRYWFKWDGRNEHGNTVATGVYFVRLTTSKGLSFIQKMAFVK
jgi:hypothetical protein